MFSLKDRVAIITGGTRGIGRAIAVNMAELGANLVLNYLSNEEAAQSTVKEVEALGAKAILYKGDVGKTEVAQGGIDLAVKHFGKLDILVNNAGITADNILMRMTDEEWDSVIETNLRSTFLWTRAALRPMLRQRYGRIIIVSSIGGIVGNAGQSNYSAAKAGQIGFMRSLAREVASRGITVNSVAPGLVLTGMTEFLTEDQWAELMKRIPMNRDGKPEEISPTVAFLATDEAAYITGKVIAVDGGLT